MRRSRRTVWTRAHTTGSGRDHRDGTRLDRRRRRRHQGARRGGRRARARRTHGTPGHARPPGRRACASRTPWCRPCSRWPAARRSPGVGVAAAGFVDASGGRVMFAPHLPWQGEDVRDRLADRWGVPVTLDNDANGAAVAEWTYGAARGARSADRRHHGHRHRRRHHHRRPPACAGPTAWPASSATCRSCPAASPASAAAAGCWEQYSSGNALVRFARARMGEQPSVLEEATGGNPDLVTGPMVTEAAEDGDLVARQAFASVGRLAGRRRRQPRRRLRPRGGRHRRRRVRRRGPAARARPGPRWCARSWAPPTAGPAARRGPARPGGRAGGRGRAGPPAAQARR